MTPLPLLLQDPSARPIVAHRGASAYAPENTLAAFRLAIEQGADAFELDVQTTADGVPVVIHDATLDRTTDRTGPVAEMALEAVREADAGARFTPDRGRSFPWRGRGVRVPTLAEVLEQFPRVPLIVEIKSPRAQHAVRRVIEEHEAVDRCVVASAEATALHAFSSGPFLLGASRRDIAWLYLRSLLRLPWPARSRYCAVAAPERYGRLRVCSRAFVNASRRSGCPVHTWTVNDPAIAAALWRNGVSGVITDVPDVMRLARDESR